jgi:hypothetical protein
MAETWTDLPAGYMPLQAWYVMRQDGPPMPTEIDQPRGGTEASALYAARMWLRHHAPDMAPPDLVVWEPAAGTRYVLVRLKAGN